MVASKLLPQGVQLQLRSAENKTVASDLDQALTPALSSLLIARIIPRYFFRLKKLAEKNSIRARFWEGAWRPGHIP